MTLVPTVGTLPLKNGNVIGRRLRSTTQPTTGIHPERRGLNTLIVMGTRTRWVGWPLVVWWFGRLIVPGGGGGCIFLHIPTEPPPVAFPPEVGM